MTLGVWLGTVVSSSRCDQSMGLVNGGPYCYQPLLLSHLYVCCSNHDSCQRLAMAGVFMGLGSWPLSPFGWSHGLDIPNGLNLCKSLYSSQSSEWSLSQFDI